jgi:hypothetical protein
VRAIAGMLVECLAMIAEHDNQRPIEQAARAKAVEQRTQCTVSLMDGVLVHAQGCVHWEGTIGLRSVRMVAGRGQIRHEKWAILRPVIDPFQDA